MLYECLSNSITEQLKAMTMLKPNEYYHMGNIPCGAAYLKVIIRKAQIDTWATVLQLRGSVSSLDTYISTMSYDIINFNEYVEDIMDSLIDRGETIWSTCQPLQVIQVC